MPQKATAARPPADPKPLAAVPRAAPPATVQALGQQLREMLPPRRVQSVSLWDHDANNLWLSEGALGPDEQTVVVEALEALGADSSSPCHESGLEDGRIALVLPVRTPTGAVVGLAMILADSKSVGDDTLERVTAAPVRAVMQRLAVLLKPDDARPAAATTEIPVLELEPTTRVELAPKPAPPAPASAPAPRATTPSLMSDREVNDILEFELTPEDLPPPPRPRVNGSAGHRATDPLAPRAKDTVAQRAKETPGRRATDTFGRRATDTVAPRFADTSTEMLSLEFLPDAPPEIAPDQIPVLQAAPVTQVNRVVRDAPAPPPPSTPTPAPEAPVAREAAAAPPEPMALSEAPIARKEPAAAVAPAIITAQVNDARLILEVLPYAKLRAGGQSRRFQILPRASPRETQRDPAAFDALILQRLLGWLAAHRTLWNSQPTSFTVNLSIATLEDDRFAHKVAAALNAHGIAAESIGFEIAEALCAQRRAQVERFIAQCDKLGAGVIIDDFSFDSQVLPMLRSKAVRLVKIDAKLSASALKDKLSQALVVAAVQAAKVMGIHCAAKRVDTQAVLQWLTAIGFDLAQGAALMPAQPLDALASSTDLTLPGGAIRSS